MDKKKRTNLIIFAVVTVACIVLGCMSPFTGLDKSGMIFLALFIWWIMMMIVELIPNALSCIITLVLAIAFKCGDTATAFSAFAGSTVWLVIGAFGLAAALTNSGLLNRLALNVMRLFPGTYKGQVIGLTVASIICAPCVPSTTAKCTVLMPIAGIIGDKMGYEPHSKPIIGLFNVVNVITNNAGCFFMTGGALVGIMIAASGQTVSWFEWLKLFIVWGLVVVVITVLHALIFYKPAAGEGKTLEKAEVKAMTDALGPMSRKEKIALAVLIATIAAWITESMHGIPTYAVALASWIIMAAFGLFSPAEIMSKILWPIVLQVGGILGVVTLMSKIGVSTWISGLIAPVLTSVAGSPIVLVLCVSLLATLLMFAMVQGPVTSALFVVLLAGSTSVNPLIIAFAAQMSALPFVFQFQLPTVLAAEGIYGSRIAHKDIVPSAWVYLVSNLVALAISVPYWSLIGYIG